MSRKKLALANIFFKIFFRDFFSKLKLNIFAGNIIVKTMENKNTRIPFKTDKFTVAVYLMAAVMFALQCAIMVWGLTL